MEELGAEGFFDGLRSMVTMIVFISLFQIKTKCKSGERRRNMRKMYREKIKGLRCWLLAVLLLTLLALMNVFSAFVPSFAWVYPDCTEDLKFERWGPRVDRVIIRMYSTEAIAFIAFENGQFDMIDWSITRYFLDRWSAPPYNETIKIIPLPPPGVERGYYVLDENCNPNPTLMDGTPNPAYPAPTSVSSFRHALAHCVDRADYVVNITEGLSVPMYTLILPCMTYWKHPEIRPGGLLEDLTHPFNLTMAAELMTADDFLYIPAEYPWRFWDGKPGSGQPRDGHYQAGEEFQLTFYGRSDAWRNNIAVKLSTILEGDPIKVDVNLILADASTCWQKVMVEKNFHMYTGGWIFMGPEPDYLYDLYNGAMYWHPGDPPNYGCYNCTEFNYWSSIVKFPGARTMPEIREACLRAQEEWATPCCICAVPLISTASPKAFARAYTGGNGGVPIGDGEDKYRGLMWKDIVNELKFGSNSYWTKLNAHPAGYETGDCQNMTLRYGFKVSSLRKLNIIYSSYYWDMQILGLIYDTLLMRDPNTLGDFIPWLAKKLETFEWVDPEDGETKTGVWVTLRPSVKWSDGHPLQAHDVVFTFMELPRKLKERGFPEPWWSSYVWPTAKSVYEVDPCNVVILYDALAPAWAKVWAGIAVPILPRHIWKPIVDTGDPTGALPPNLPDPNLVGTGPFKRDPAADWYNPPSWIKLVKNTQFFHYCPIDVDPQIDAPELYKGMQVFPPSTPADQLKFTVQIQNMYWNQCRGSELWIDKYVYFSNKTGEYLLPGYPKNIHLPGRNAFLRNVTHVDMTNPISSIWEQTYGCPPQTELFHVIGWEDNCDKILSPCDKLFLECLTNPAKTGWYHVETVNPVPADGGLPIMIEVAYEDKEEISLADLPYPYNKMTSWPCGQFDIKVAVHVKGPPMIWVYTWTLAEFLADPQIPAHYELVPNPWVCQWINATLNFWVTIPEDLNLDCRVNYLDLILVGGAYGSYLGHRAYNYRADVNRDNVIDMRDVLAVESMFGWECGKPFTPLICNIAVIDVTVSKTILGQGYPTDVAVTVQNKGNYTVSFMVNVKFNSTVVKSKTIWNLQPGATEKFALLVVPETFVFEERWRTSIAELRSVDVSRDGTYVAFLSNDTIGIVRNGTTITSHTLLGTPETYWLDATQDMMYIAITNGTGVEFYTFDGVTLQRTAGTTLIGTTKEVRLSENKTYAVAPSGTKMNAINAATGGVLWSYDAGGGQFACDGDDNLNYIIGGTQTEPYKYFILKNLGNSYQNLAEGTMAGPINDLDSTPDGSYFAFGSDAGEYLLLRRTGDTITTVFSGRVQYDSLYPAVESIEIGNSTLFVGSRNFVNLYDFNGNLLLHHRYPLPDGEIWATVADYDSGLHVAGTNYGQLCFTREKGPDYGEISLGTEPVQDVRIEDRYIVAAQRGKITLLEYSPVSEPLSRGNYTVSASADILPGETDPLDNNSTDGWIFVTIPGDINGDKTVNILDCIILANHFGHTNGNGHTPNTKEWKNCMNSNINCDGTVNILDCIILAGHFGQKW